MEDAEEDPLVSSTHEQQTLVLRDRRGELLDLGVLLEDPLDLGWQLVKACDDLVAALGKRDAIFGEGGSDELLGGTGADLLNFRDNDTRDRVDCGAAKDRVRAEPIDRVRRCEL